MSAERNEPRNAMSGALDVRHCDNHVLVVVKRAGMPCVPDASGDTSLYDVAREWVRTEFAKPGNVFLGVVQRLDRPVSGLVVFARTSKGADRLARQFRQRTARKIYWAVAQGLRGGAQGRPRAGADASEGVVDHWLSKDADENRVHVVAPEAPHARRAVTRWRILETRNERVLYEFEPETGRPHQLRVCAATLGTPLLGDLKYGARAALPDKSVALHARALAFEHPTRAEELTFESAVPELDVWRFERTR
jgi:23S rRNA pseudouridine1911/1915/1917 synthase